MHGYRVGLAWLVMCACTGRGFVDGEEGGDASDGSSDSVASLDSVGSRDDGADDAADTANDDGTQADDVQWLLAIATFLDPAHPLQWHVLVDYENGELVDVRLQSLSLDVGSTTSPRQLVGDVIVADELRFDDVGNFGLRTDELLVPAEANPITGSAIMAMNVRLTGMGTATTSCGTVEGDVVTPIQTSLVGSTFAAVPITSVADLPLEFPSACP